MQSVLDRGRSLLASGFRLAMFAGFRIETLIWQEQAFHRLSAYDVGFDNLVDIGFGDMPVPNGFGIYNDRRTVLTLIETAGLVRPHSALQSPLGELLLEHFLQFGLGAGIAA